MSGILVGAASGYAPAVGGGGGTGNLVHEGFEGTGTPTGWFQGGSANFDYSASPLVGSQSLRCDPATGDYVVVTEASGFINHAEIWFKFTFKFEGALSADPSICYLQDTGFNTVLEIKIFHTSGVLHVQDGPTNIYVDTVDILSAGTVYDIWGHYRAGSGVNALAEASFATTGSARPNSGNKYCGASTGHSTGNATRLFFSMSSSGSAGVFDAVEVSSTDIF